MATLLDGKKFANELYGELKNRCIQLKKKGIQPGLATVLVGDDPASHVYVGQKIKKCEEVGLVSIHRPLPANVNQDKLLEVIRGLNQDPKVHGIIVQLPLPSHLDADQAVETIDNAKDADGLHPLNQGTLARCKSWRDIENSGIPLPCTPAGVIYILQKQGVQIGGKEVVIVGRSMLVGKPLAQLFMSLDATVTIAHSKTHNLPEVCQRADILVAAIGKPEFIQKTHVRKGVIAVDVGISRTVSGLKGDIDFKAVEPVASLITPVPGGVGPMTVAMLIRNTVLNAEKARVL